MFGVMLSIALFLLTPCVSAVYSTHVRSEVSTRVDQIKNDMVRTVGSLLDSFVSERVDFMDAYLSDRCSHVVSIYSFFLIDESDSRSTITCSSSVCTYW